MNGPIPIMFDMLSAVACSRPKRREATRPLRSLWTWRERLPEKRPGCGPCYHPPHPLPGMNALPPLSAFTVFLAIAAVGFLFLMVSLVFGEIFDAFRRRLDHDFDHGGPGFFSTRVMAVFVTAFGGFGAIATHYGLSPLPASGVGFASGLVFGGAIYVFARFLYSQQAGIRVRAGDLVGQIARVVIAHSRRRRRPDPLSASARN